MSTEVAKTERPNVPQIAQPRLPYHPAIEQRFGVDQSSWRALVESIFPSAKSTEAVILALSYCRARHLDPFKRTVHIVPVWDSKRGCEVETVWPGIAELRTTACRTREYAGRDKTEFGPTITETFRDGDNEVTTTYPEWAQVTLYRLIAGELRKFVGPSVYWKETYATKSRKTDAPNAMWGRRPRGQLEKCAEAAALRAAFPEEIGGEYAAEEVEGGFQSHGRPAIEVTPSQSLEADLKAMRQPEAAPEPQAEPAPESTEAQAGDLFGGEPAADDGPGPEAMYLDAIDSAEATAIQGIVQQARQEAGGGKLTAKNLVDIEARAKRRAKELAKK